MPGVVLVPGSEHEWENKGIPLRAVVQRWRRRPSWAGEVVVAGDVAGEVAGDVADDVDWSMTPLLCSSTVDPRLLA